jgi:hypothetical protein
MEQANSTEDESTYEPPTVTHLGSVRDAAATTGSTPDIP